jgi:hypothetical protein
MLLNAYLICLRFTQGSTIKRIVRVRISVLGRVRPRGVSSRIVQLRGASLDGKITFPLMKKGERFIRCIAHRHGSRGSDDHRRIMSDMTSVLHDMTSILNHSVAINAKGGDS